MPQEPDPQWAVTFLEAYGWLGLFVMSCFLNVFLYKQREKDRADLYSQITTQYNDRIKELSDALARRLHS